MVRAKLWLLIIFVGTNVTEARDFEKDLERYEDYAHNCHSWQSHKQIYLERKLKSDWLANDWAERFPYGLNGINDRLAFWCSEFHKLKDELGEDFRIQRSERIERKDKARFLYDLRPREVCSIVGNPGDLLLQRISNEESDQEFKNKYDGIHFLGQVLSLNPSLGMKYGHAELIYQITNLEDLLTVSYYPKDTREGKKAEDRLIRLKKFMYYDNAWFDHRSYYDVFRLTGLGDKDLAKKRSAAIEKVLHPEDYGDRGLCSDFVNWAYDNYITSWWNFLPLIRQGIATIYPPESVTLPDNLADSPFAKRVCKVRKKLLMNRSGAFDPDEDPTDLIEPHMVCTADLMRSIRSGLSVENDALNTHADELAAFLESKDILDSEGQMLVSKIYFTEFPDHALRIRKCPTH